MKWLKKNNRGYTIIESLLVLAAIAILANVLIYILFQNFHTFEDEGTEISRTHAMQTTMAYVVNLARRTNSIAVDDENRLVLNLESKDYRIFLQNDQLLQTTKAPGEPDLSYSNQVTLLEDVSEFTPTYADAVLNIHLEVTGIEGRIFELNTDILNRKELN